MRASASEVVVLVPIDKDDTSVLALEEVVRTLGGAHKAWNSKPNLPSGQSLSALFVWLDSERWEDWLGNMYGYKEKKEKGMPPRAIIANHKVRALSLIGVLISGVVADQRVYSI